ncbi:hypothetical protein BJ322DRAFT_584113 [Thelephora terrestris]|uniref:Uncharacterized protein n=1 Tax=Thelephora terrestris TaxID=56493 RepID=A0A9P6HIM1_9AGAM|nr:hypothetical protein BJ322DRAFT_584113 [Thelephora terrestris]
MMEASIRQFHFIAAEADVQLTRKLCSIKTPNIVEKRQALIEEHKQSMEAQASSLLTDMSALHDQLKERHTMVSRGLFDFPVNEDGWERPLPPSTVPWKIPSPSLQSTSSDFWKPASSPPKAVEVPKPQVSSSGFNPEPELAMPSFWKPSWDADIAEPSTPSAPPISRLATVEDAPEESGIPEPAVLTPPIFPKNAKLAQAPMKNQIPNVVEEPTPVWGQPWRKGQSSCPLPHSLLTHEVATGKQSVSNNSSNQAIKPTQASPPLPPVIEKPSVSPPVTAPPLGPAPVSASTPSEAQTKPKTPKQLRAERNRKGKNRATTKEDVVEEWEEVPTPPPQGPQPAVSRNFGIDAVIDNMVNTGNVQSALEQISRGWK